MPGPGAFWKEIWTFLCASKDHWKELTGGSLVAILLGVGASMGLNVPPLIAGMSAFVLVIVCAAFLAWRDQYRGVQGLRREVTELRDSKADEGHRAARECFQKAAELLKSGDGGDFPFHALCKAGAHLLPTNDLVLEACGYLISYGHGNPFAGLDEYVPESEYRDFLVWIHYSPDFNPHVGVEYLDAADAWRKKMGHAEPSQEGRLSLTFAKALDKVPPLDRRTLKKGLKVSVVNLSIDPPSTVVIRTIFINDGPVTRTVLAVALAYYDWERDIRYSTGGTREDGSITSDASTAMAVGPNSEATPIFRISLPTDLFKKAGTSVVLDITATDGKGASRLTSINLLTVNPVPERGGFSYTPARVTSVLLDEEK